ncbi:MAG TPA: DUF1735 domain-containing protein [Bacteroidetes bacterium]|nr:DUF1735 domain-containing protein [Bacteroidota bacterium]
MLITGTETGKLVPFTAENAPAQYAVTATATSKVSQYVIVSFAVDTNLVTAYNAEVSGKYFAAPAGSYQLLANTATIKAGTNVSAPVMVEVLSLNNFVTGRTYIPGNYKKRNRA